MDANKNAPGATNAEGNANDSTVKITADNTRADARQSTLADLLGIPMPTGTEARAARDAALDRITRRTDPAWLAMAEGALLAAIDRLGSACVDDCRDTIPPPSAPCWWCIVPRMLCDSEIIRRVGSRPGQAPVTHGGDLRLWARMEAKL